MKNSLVETLVGALVIAIAATFFFFVYSKSGASAGRGGYVLSATFDNIDGINVGSDIRMAGIKVGSVLDQSLDSSSYQAVVKMAIDSSVKLPDDSTAKVTSEGLLGGKYIALEPGGSEKILKDGETLTYTQSAIDLWGLINQFMFSNKGGSGTDSGSQSNQ